jgi:hypothetical protein
LDLRHRIGQLVIGVEDLLRTHPILHRYGNGDEYVVFGLSLHGQRDLIYAQAHGAGHRIQERPLPVQARFSHPKELAEARDDGHFGRAHGEKASQNQVEQDERQQAQRYPIKLFHLVS